MLLSGDFWVSALQVSWGNSALMCTLRNGDLAIDSSESSTQRIGLIVYRF